MIIAIDGPAGAGKSTVARAIAGALGFTYLDTGAMYRAVALKALEEGTDLGDGDALGELAANLKLKFEPAASGADDRLRVLEGARDITAAIRTPEVTEASSQVAARPAVRAAMVKKQRELMAAGDCVAEGRDVGTIVAPAAEVKLFLTASAEERARRRLGDFEEGGVTADLAQVTRDQEARDARDEQRAVSPLKRAADAIELDTTGLGVENVVERIVAIVDERRVTKPGSP